MPPAYLPPAPPPEPAAAEPHLQHGLDPNLHGFAARTAPVIAAEPQPRHELAPRTVPIISSTDGTSTADWVYECVARKKRGTTDAWKRGTVQIEIRNSAAGSGSVLRFATAAPHATHDHSVSAMPGYGFVQARWSRAPTAIPPEVELMTADRTHRIRVEAGSHQQLHTSWLICT